MMDLLFCRRRRLLLRLAFALRPKNEPVPFFAPACSVFFAPSAIVSQFPRFSAN